LKHLSAADVTHLVVAEVDAAAVTDNVAEAKDSVEAVVTDLEVADVAVAMDPVVALNVDHVVELARPSTPRTPMLSQALDLRFLLHSFTRSLRLVCDSKYRSGTVEIKTQNVEPI
jgi:hypothetical protein